MVELLSLCGMVMEAYGRGNDPMKRKYYALEQKIYSNCEDFSSGDLIRRDSQSGQLARKWNENPPEYVIKTYDQFVDDAFWEELIFRMAERDLKLEMECAGIAPGDGEESWAERRKELEYAYEQEFRDKGLSSLSLSAELAGEN